jgi:predicted enzyme related to lactoylglutathione lyase
MPTIDRPVIGNFCWVEVNSEHPARAKAFYGELFGWTFEDVRYPAAGEYSLVKKGDAQLGGIFRLPEDAMQRGARPSWLGYVAVEDVTVATKKAEGLGARVYKPPFDAGPGRMSIVADPTGAPLALWQSAKPTGTYVWREPNTMTWFELTTTDPAAATRFYVEMFGWRTELVPMGELEYTLLYNGNEQVAGLMPQPKPMRDAKAPSFWTVYFEVEDCDASVARATKLGAETVHPPTDIPNVGRFAILRDGEGAGLALIEPHSRS